MHVTVTVYTTVTDSHCIYVVTWGVKLWSRIIAFWRKISANIRKKAKSAKKWLRSKIAANRAGFFSHYHFHALQSNLRLYCTKPINSSAELITIYALRLSLEAFRIDYETCKYFICWKEQRKFKCSRTFTFAIHTHNRKMFARCWHASLSPEQIG